MKIFNIIRKCNITYKIIEDKKNEKNKGSKKVYR